jgi:hypothetical protein
MIVSNPYLSVQQRRSIINSHSPEMCFEEKTRLFCTEWMKVAMGG